MEDKGKRGGGPGGEGVGGGERGEGVQADMSFSLKI